MAWTDFIMPAVQGVAGYFDYKDRENRRDEMNKAYNASVEADKAAWEAKQAGGGSRGGGGGGGGGRNTGAMKQILQDYYAQSNAMLQPYMDAAKQVLPGMTKAYQTGLDGFNPLAEKVLSKEYIDSLLTHNAPPPMALPEYLVGGKK
jgi:hypothetical protein